MILLFFGHGKLDLSFVHGRAEKFIDLLHISWPKSKRKNNLPQVLEKKVCLFADTFTYVSNCYYK